MPESSRFELEAKAAYDAYCKYRNWKGFEGQPLPQWPEVREDIKAGWRIAAEAVLKSHADRSIAAFIALEKIRRKHPNFRC